MHERTVYSCLFMLSPIMTFNLTVIFTLNHYYKLLFIRITYYTKNINKRFQDGKFGFLQITWMMNRKFRRIKRDKEDCMSEIYHEIITIKHHRKYRKGRKRRMVV